MRVPASGVFVVNSSVLVMHIALRYGGGGGLRRASLHGDDVGDKGSLHNDIGVVVDNRLGRGGSFGRGRGHLCRGVLVRRLLAGADGTGRSLCSQSRRRCSAGEDTDGRSGRCGSGGNGADASATRGVGLIGAKDNDSVGRGPALGSSEVVSGNVVSLTAKRLASRAADAPAPRVGGNDGDTVLLEGEAVDVAQVIPEGAVGKSVLELGNVLAFCVGTHLDGDTTAVGVDLVSFGVLATVGIESLHGSVHIANGPEVDLEGALVVDNGGAASRDLTGSGKQHSCAGEEVRSNHFCVV